MPLHAQEVSALAWDDEAHVVDNRRIYREKFDIVGPMLSKIFGVHQPEGAFYYWPELPMDDEEFTKQLFVAENITVLPGSYFARDTEGENPGKNRVRLAMVATLNECVDGVRRLCEFTRQLLA